MDDYKKMYYTLFNKITDIIYELQIVQRKAEDMCPAPTGKPRRLEANEQKTPHLILNEGKNHS